MWHIMGTYLPRQNKLIFETGLFCIGKLCFSWSSEPNLFFIIICSALLIKAIIYWPPVSNTVLREADTNTELGTQGFLLEDGSILPIRDRRGSRIEQGKLSVWDVTWHLWKEKGQEGLGRELRLWNNSDEVNHQSKECPLKSLQLNFFKKVTIYWMTAVSSSWSFFGRGCPRVWPRLKTVAVPNGPATGGCLLITLLTGERLVLFLMRLHLNGCHTTFSIKTIKIESPWKHQFRLGGFMGEGSSK